MSDLRNYLVLTSMTKAIAAAGEKLIANIEALDQKAKPLWFDASHVGIVLTTELPAIDIWNAAVEGITDLHDVLILEIGSDWMARHESKYSNWLATHVGHPRRTSTPRKPGTY